MDFEWDPKKSEGNRTKHGIGFERAKDIWMDEDRIEINAPNPVEGRGIIIGKLEKKLWSAIYTLRGEKIRIISVRRARKKEEALYENQKG